MLYIHDIFMGISTFYPNIYPALLDITKCGTGSCVCVCVWTFTQEGVPLYIRVCSSSLFELNNYSTFHRTNNIKFLCICVMAHAVMVRSGL